MSDVFSKEKRSEIMSKVRSSGNRSTELKLIAFFKESHIVGWRRHYNVIGHPDFVFKERRIAVFVDGCFWHGHDCRNTQPRENTEFWQKKRERNIQHDLKITHHFEERGWRVIRIWECELKKKNKPILIEKLRELCSNL
ncbi:MAG: very short patch repair endonuclease [Acidobacteriota bacterium]